MAEKKAPASDTKPAAGDSGSTSIITPQAITEALLAVDGLADIRKPFAAGAPLLAAAGLCVFPLAPGSKKPLVRWGAGATTDAATIAHWAHRWPDAGVAIACKPSGLLVVDLDTKNPPVDGRVSWAEVTWASGAHDAAAACYYDRTTLIKTASGGLHLWFADPDGTPGRDAMLPGIDVKAAQGLRGGFAVAPPSPGYSVLGLKPPTQVPGWLMQILTHDDKPKRAATTLPPMAVPVASAQTRKALAAALRKRRRS